MVRTASIVGHPVVARTSVLTVSRGGCAFRMSMHTGGALIGRSVRTLFNMSIGGMGVVGIHNGLGHVNGCGNCAGGHHGTVVALARGSGAVRLFRGWSFRVVG